MANFTTNQITGKAKVINAVKAVLLALVVVSLVQVIADRLIIAIIMSDIDLWFKWSNEYWLRYWSVVVILGVIYYFKGINKIVDKARKENDRLRYHLYDNSNPQ